MFKLFSSKSLAYAAFAFGALIPLPPPAGDVVASAQVKVLTGDTVLELRVLGSGQTPREATVNAVRELARQLDTLLPAPQPSAGKLGMEVVP